LTSGLLSSDLCKEEVLISS